MFSHCSEQKNPVFIRFLVEEKTSQWTKLKKKRLKKALYSLLQWLRENVGICFLLALIAKFCVYVLILWKRMSLLPFGVDSVVQWKCCVLELAPAKCTVPNRKKIHTNERHTRLPNHAYPIARPPLCPESLGTEHLDAPNVLFLSQWSHLQEEIHLDCFIIKNIPNNPRDMEVGTERDTFFLAKCFVELMNFQYSF